eukprot:c23633_g1_i1 orf=97-1239(+)
MDEEEEEEDERKEEEKRRGEWWSWGAGTHGQLGTGTFQDELLPQPLPSPSPAPLLHLACGGSHSVAALSNGEAVTWGNGNSGQLGHGDSRSCCEPTIVKELQFIKIRTVSAGWSHTVFISDDNGLFTCGSGGYGQLGHGNLDSCSIPKRVNWFASMRVSLAACGMRHTLVLADSGKGTGVYAFGSSKKGQLGIGSPGEGSLMSKEFLEANYTCHPNEIGSLNGLNISTICANGDHSAALSDNGDLFVWGRSFSTTSNILLPKHISSELRFSQVALGWNHLLALTYDGQVYAIGSKRYGALNGIQKPMVKGHCGSGSTVINKELPREGESALSSQVSEVSINLFEPLKGSVVRWVAAGSEHSAAVLSRYLFFVYWNFYRTD